MSYSDIDPTGVQWERRAYFDVLNDLLDTAGAARPAVIAIDGHSGSGKSTLARGLAALEPHSTVIHTDELQSPCFGWAEQLVDHVLVPLQQRRLPITHSTDHGVITIAAGVTAVFIEGVGAARRETRPWLDVVVWVHAREADDPFGAESALLGDHRPWEVADVLVSGDLGQPAHDGRYGNVVTAPGPAGVAKQS